MKKVNPILSTAFIMVFFSAALSFSDQDIVCIDPGHGGPGADKFHNGGDGYGNAGPVLGIAEQWVNLQVALGKETPRKILASSLKIIKLIQRDNSNLSFKPALNHTVQGKEEGNEE